MTSPNILVLGSGGREHALCWHLKRSGAKVECAPGSDAISKLCPVWSFKNFKELLKTIQSRKFSEIIVGPEKYLAEGVADFLVKNGISVFGPSQRAAQFETDKAFAKSFMNKYKLPTARSVTIKSSAELTKALKTFQPPFVVKAAGLAAGKGVWIGHDLKAATEFGNAMLKSHSSVVIEEFLSGEEISYFVLIDGEHSLFFGSAQDHKRLLENDLGPNTGGMGAYSPVPLLTPELQSKIKNKIIAPFLAGLKDEKIFYRGFLFVGLMIVADEPYVLEFNCRMGDPETQALMLRLKTPITQAINQIAGGQPVEFLSEVSLCVVVAADGYPEKPKSNFILPKIDMPAKNLSVFHSGTQWNGKNWMATGGRLFSVGTAQTSLIDCQNAIYSWIEDLRLNDITYRKDIGAKAFKYLITASQAALK